MSRFPHELSGGQRQRVVIAGALVMDPEVIVADEPVSMLDVSIRTELLRLMLDVRRERGLTYLFITHDLSLAWVIADRIAVMYLGKIMEIGPAETVIRSPRNPYTQALVSVSPSPDPPTAGTAGEAHDPRGRDARWRPCPDRLPVPPALSGRVRSLQGGGAAVVRPRRRPVRRVLAGREGRAAGPRYACLDGRCTVRGCGHVSETTALSPARIADLLAASATTIVAELVALGEEGGWRPDQGEWSANECVGHVADRRTLDDWGAERIERKLRAAGLAPDLIAAALATRNSQDELDAAVALLRRRFAGPPASERDRERALGVLVRKGYELDLAYDAVRAYEREAA